MTTVAQSNSGWGSQKTFSLVNVNDETPKLYYTKGKTCLIHCTGVSGSTVQVLCYTNTNTTGVPLTLNGTSSFTADFTAAFESPGGCSITVKLTSDGGTVTVNITH